MNNVFFIDYLLDYNEKCLIIEYRDNVEHIDDI